MFDDLLPVQGPVCVRGGGGVNGNAKTAWFLDLAN